VPTAPEIDCTDVAPDTFASLIPECDVSVPEEVCGLCVCMCVCVCVHVCIHVCVGMCTCVRARVYV